MQYRPVNQSKSQLRRWCLLVADMVDRVRTHPKVQKWIERLTTMSPEEYLQSLRDWRPNNELWKMVKTWPMVKPLKDMATETYNKVCTLLNTP